MDAYREANRGRWDAWTRINLASPMYDVEAFAAGRGRDLDPIARAGPGDVRGKSLLHLQCHFGMDTIRWARHGATVTGVDFSAEAIAAARVLAARMAVPARFVHSDLYELPGVLDGRFDVVFTSHGVLGWLHPLSAVMGSLLRAGLRIEAYEEYPFLSWRFFPWMEQGADGWWRLPVDRRLPQGPGSLPLMFSLKATLP